MKSYDRWLLITMAKRNPTYCPPNLASFFEHAATSTATSTARAGDYFSAKCLYPGSLEMLERCCLHLDRADGVWEGIKNLGVSPLFNTLFAIHEIVLQEYSPKTIKNIQRI